MYKIISRVFFFVVLSSLLLFTGCSKSNKKVVSIQPKTVLISSSSWKYSMAGIDKDDNGTLDLPLPAGTFQNCDTDNTLTFKSDHTGVSDEGPTKCAGTNPQSTNFTWSLNNNESELHFSTNIFAGVGGDFKLIELTDTQMVLSKQSVLPSTTIPATIIIVLKH